jgi:hypothetical protein
MAAMSTALTKYDARSNFIVYTLASHTALSPYKVIQRRREPTGNQVVTEQVLSVFKATENSDGVLLPQKVAMDAVVRYPVTGLITDIALVLATFRDIVNGDEFENMIYTLEPLV